MSINWDSSLSSASVGKRVLITHPDPSRHLALQQAMSEHDVVAVSHIDDAIKELRRTPPDLVIADASGARRLLKECESVAPRATRLFLCDMSDLTNVRALLELAAEGHLFSTLDESLPLREIAHRLARLLSARASARVAPRRGLEATFEINGRRRLLEVADISNNGVALLVASDGDVNELTPGSDLVHFRLKQGKNTILRADRAYLKHLRFDERAPVPHFRAGVAFGEQKELEVSPAINDPMRIMGLVRRAVSRGTPLHVRNWADRSRTFALKEANLSPLGGQLILHGHADGCVLSPGDIAQIQFEVNGLSYAGLAASAPFLQLKTGRLAFFVPTSVALRHRRQHARFKVNPSRPFAVTLVSPITGERLVRPVVDLQTSGLSFTFDASLEALPVGLAITDMELSLPDGSSTKCTATVRDSGQVPDNVSTTGFITPRRCGLSLQNVPTHVKEAILEAFLSERSPSMRAAKPDDFARIWEVIRGAGGFYPDYPLEDGEHLRKLEDSFRKLQASGEGVGKVLLYDDDNNTPIGHASGLRYYSHTWVLQHLAVKPGFTRDRFTGRDLSSQVVEQGELLEDVEWVRKIWNVKNRWVNRIGGWIAKTLLSQNLCYLRTFNFMHWRIPGDFKSEHLAVRSGGHEDRLRLERFLIRSGQALRMKTDDLSAQEFDLPTLRERLRPWGLERGRHLFVSTENPQLLAVVEDSTEGLHWGEFLNSFSLFNIGGQKAEPQALMSLVAACVEHYRSRGRPSAVGLVDDEYTDLIKSMGFTHFGKFSEFTFHRSAVQSSIQLFSAVFERLQRMMERSALREVDDLQTGPGMGPISGVTPIPVTR